MGWRGDHTTNRLKRKLATEPKSYIHLEYEYALEQNKPFFAVVITDAYLDEKVRTQGRHVLEEEHGQKLREFKNIVRSRMVRFWSNSDQIKLAIHETMREFTDRPDVTGWVPGNEAVNTGPALEQIAQLTAENMTLKRKLGQKEWDLEQAFGELEQTHKEMGETNKELEQTHKELEQTHKEPGETRNELEQAHKELEQEFKMLKEKLKALSE